MSRGGGRRGAMSSPKWLLAAALSAAVVGACGGSPQPTPKPVATLDLTSVSFPPSPSPTPVPPGQKAAQAFLAFAGGDRTSFHIAFKGTIFATVSSPTVSGTVDAAGLDVATSTHYVFD